MSTDGRFKIDIDCSPARVRSVVLLLAAANVCVILGSAAFAIYYRNHLGGDWDKGSDLKFLLVQFHLARENVLASWYSSMLLLLVAVAAIVCFAVDHKQRLKGFARLLSYAWLFMAFAFALLSLDEMGSLHERAGMLAALNPFGAEAAGWVYALAIPIAVVAAFILAFGWAHVRRCRLAFAFVFLGVILFVSNPLLELVQMSMLDAAGKVTLNIELSMLLEESAEMFGALSFFTAFVVYAAHSAKQIVSKDVDSPSVIQLEVSTKLALFAACLFVAVFAAASILVETIIHGVEGEDDGIPRNWFSSALAALASIYCLQIWDSMERTRRLYRALFIAAAFYCALLSLYYGANLKNWLLSSELEDYPVKSLIENSLLIGAVILGTLLASQARRWWSQLAMVGWPILLLCAFFFGPLYAIGPCDFLAVAVLFVGILALSTEQSFCEPSFDAP